MEIRSAIFIASDLLLAELQRGADVVDIHIGDKIRLETNGNAVSLFVGDVAIVASGEIENTFLFHHEAHRAFTGEARGVFSKVVKGGDFGLPYIYDIPNCLKYNFKEIDERARESYVHLLQSLSWMLRTDSLEWMV